jgi:hypothetical protein
MALHPEEPRSGVTKGEATVRNGPPWPCDNSFAARRLKSDPDQIHLRTGA